MVSSKASTLAVPLADLKEIEKVGQWDYLWVNDLVEWKDKIGVALLGI